jgi:hypothetical protein
MREQIEQRLSALQAEFKSGQEILNDLEQKQLDLRGTLIRISGAIQVLEELLSKESPSLINSSAPASEVNAVAA